MIEQELYDLTQYALTKAENALHAAKLLVKAGMYDDAISRAYYAIFGTARALVTIDGDGYSFSKHGGVLAHFDRNYVKEGIFPKQYSQIIHRAFQVRQMSDYGIDGMDDFSTAEEAEVAVEEA